MVKVTYPHKFRCPHCGSRFKFAQDLNAHILRAHNAVEVES